MFRFFLFIFIFTSAVSCGRISETTTNGERRLNSVTPPQKFLDQEMKIAAPNDTKFPVAMLGTNEFVVAKSSQWRACGREDVNRPSAEAGGESLAEFLETPNYIKTLNEMDKKKLREGTASSQPWSGDYWAIAGGILGARFMEPAFSELSDWLPRFNFIQQNPTSQVLSSQGQAGVGKLSPAEKYDLIAGDETSKLAAVMWAEGKSYFDSTGSVETWMGICHGWAPAAIREPRPAHAIDVKTPDSRWTVHLNPSELKGLISYSWASNRYSTKFLGQRCNKKNPKVDNNGRVIDPECFDTNPASWHLAIVNSLGAAGRSFVMDATYDYQVWNQPVWKYTYTYFNPETKEAVADLAGATVALENFGSDKFKKYRSPKTKSVVGISMKVAYIVETPMNTEETDSEGVDAIRWVKYDYDLELDSRGEIIGGEWSDVSHPDFLWVPRNGVAPLSYFDNGLSTTDWTGEAIPAHWSGAVREASRRGTMVHTFSKALILKAGQ